MRGWLGLLVVVGLGACGSELPHPEIVSFTVEPEEVVAGETVKVRFELEHFTLTDDDHHHGDHHHDSVPSADHEGHDHGHDHGDSDANNNEGHIHVYLNSMDTNPIGQVVTLEAELTIPETVEVGEHVLIARLHDSAHMIIEPVVMAEADLIVTE